MRILVVGRSYPSVETGMFGTFEYDQTLIIQKMGSEVLYFFHDTRPIYRSHRIGHYIYEDEIKSIGDYLPIGHFPKPVYNMIKFQVFKRQFEKVLNCFHPDIVHIHYPSIIVSIDMWKYMRKKCDSIVLTEHYSKLMNKDLSKKRLRELTQIYKESDCTICVSEPLARTINEMCPDAQLIIIPNAVSKEIEYTEKKDNGNISFIYVGNIGGLKQVDLIIQAFCQICKLHFNCYLKIVGSGPDFKRIKKLSNKLGLESKIQFYGNVPREKVGELLGESDYFVTASKIETFCVPVVEAWYCGKPVIIPNNLPLIKYADENNSIVYKNSDLESLIHGMELAISTLGKHDEKAIIKKADILFGKDIIGQQLITLYKELLKKNGKAEKSLNCKYSHSSI